MSQELTSSRFPYLPIRVQLDQETHEAEALLDTGFDGGMAMPPFLLADLEPDWYQLWTLADGSQVSAPVFRGAVQLGDFEPIPVAVVALGDEYMIGLGILRQFSVILDHGARVIVNH